jgi:predicted metalloprotease
MAAKVTIPALLQMRRGGAASLQPGSVKALAS